MRTLALILFLVPCAMHAHDAAAFARAVNSGKVQRVDRWVKRELHRQRKGYVVTTPSTSYIAHHATFDSLVAFLRRQRGVLDATSDRCMSKIMIWPGHITIGLRWRVGEVVHERCWCVQEGIPGTINLFGWRPKVRKSREYLKYERASVCPGFVEQQRKYCAER